MTLARIDTLSLVELRRRASLRLSHDGNDSEGSQRAVEALAVLQGMAASPRSAADALALLHELQVHQVELEMQAEALQESQQALRAALQQRNNRHDALPVACVTLGRHLLVTELNRVAARLFGLASGAAVGLRLGALLSAASTHTLQRAVDRLHGGEDSACDWIEEGAQRLRADLCLAPDGDGVLLVLTPA